MESWYLPSKLYLDETDAINTVNWLNERAAGYPSLKQFEGGANYPPCDYCIRDRYS